MTNVSKLAASNHHTDESLIASISAGLHIPRRIVLPTSWVGHIPFASWVIAALKPRVVVELGVHTGNSFFTFAEAALGDGLSTVLYGIDTWAGDDHAGAYAEDVFADVGATAKERFPENVRLIRKLFDEALHDFDDGSIDLLHIDGLHTYEAVKHDFETWLPKLSDCGVVLFHDIAVVREGFGVARFWSEVTLVYPHFAFSHSNGLGVLLVGSRVPARIKVYATSEFAREGFVGLLAKLGDFLASALVRGPDVDALPINPSLDPPRIYIAAHGRFDEGSAINARPLVGAPGTLHCTIGPLPDSADLVLRIDPINHIGIRGIHRVLLSGPGVAAPIELVPEGTDRRERLSIVPHEKGYLFVGTAEDSQWFPNLSHEARDLFRTGATLVFEPIAASNAKVSRMLLESVQYLIAPLDERINTIMGLERAQALAAAETDESTVSKLKAELQVVSAGSESIELALAAAVSDASSRKAQFEREASAAAEQYKTDKAALLTDHAATKAEWAADHALLVAEHAATKAEWAADYARLIADHAATKAKWAADRELLVADHAATKIKWAADRELLVADHSAIEAEWSARHESLISDLAETQKQLTADREMLAAVRIDTVRKTELLDRFATRDAEIDRSLGPLRDYPQTEVHSDQTYRAAEEAIDALAAAGITDNLTATMRHLVQATELAKGRLLVAQRRRTTPKMLALGSGGAPTDLYLEPARGLVALNSTGTRWRSVDHDPQFAFGELSRYAGHWVEMTVAIAFDQEPSGSPVIYLDCGEGMSEVGIVALPRPEPDSGIAKIVFAVPTDLSNARFDPCAAPISFDLTTFRIRTISKFSAIRSMVRTMRHSGRLRHLRDTYQPQWRSMRSATARRDFKNAFVDAYRVSLKARSYAYSEWIRRFEPQPHSYPQLASRRLQWTKTPMISILMPTYDTPARYLREAIESVQEQNYPNWELCIADDASKAPHVRRMLDEFALRDERIKVVHRATNGHIAAASNSALELATGEFIALLDHDDRLHPLALHFVAEVIVQSPEVKMIYSDEDKIDMASLRNGPYFKSDFNYELFLAQNMVSHLGCYSTELVRELGGFHLGTEGSQDWDLGLRVYERVGAANIAHIPRVLYHWREIPGSTAVSVEEKPYAQVAGRRAVVEHITRQSIDAAVLPAPSLPSWNRVKYAVPAPHPKVSIVIPTRDKVDLLKTCVQSILTRTTYDNYQIVIVDNGSVEVETANYLESLSTEHIKVIRDDAPFNYSRLNNRAVDNASGDFICLLNNDIEVLTPDWLEEMVSIASQPTVGIVGARLWYPDMRLQHGGVILGVGGIASHSHRFIRQLDPGYFGRAVLQQQLSAVTGACLLISRRIWSELDGLDETLAVAFNDIDLCLRAGERGYRTIWTPFAELIHHESVSRGIEDTPEKIARFDAEQMQMRSRWGHLLLLDPYYSPNLTLAAEDFSLSWDPRLQ